MSVFILSNRKIMIENGKESFSNEEVSVPNFRIAKCNFQGWKEPTKEELKKKNYKGRNILDYNLLSEPQKSGYQEVLEVLKKEKNCGLHGNSEYRVSFDIILDNNRVQRQSFSFMTGEVNES